MANLTVMAKSGAEESSHEQSFHFSIFSMKANILSSGVGQDSGACQNVVM